MPARGKRKAPVRPEPGDGEAYFDLGPPYGEVLGKTSDKRKSCGLWVSYLWIPILYGGLYEPSSTGYGDTDKAACAGRLAG